MLEPHEAALVRALGPGACYAGAFLMLMLSPFRQDPASVLCHGVAVLTDGTGREFGHAWVELCDAYVFDYRFPEQAVSLARYYRLGRVRGNTVRRYTWREACEQCVAHGGAFGPWDPAVAAAAHTGDGRPA